MTDDEDNLHKMIQEEIMKKSTIVKTLGIMAMGAALLAGCGEDSGNAAQPTESEQPTEAAQENGGEETGDNGGNEEGEGNTELANPWKECTEKEAVESCPRLFRAPDGSTVNGWSMMEDSSAGNMIQLDFRLEGVDYCARAQYGADVDKDISGLYYDWDDTREVTLLYWGGSNMPATISRHVEDGWMVDLCSWYDIEIGIAYTLSAEAEDLDGFDIQAIVEQMYNPVNEPALGEDIDAGTEEDGQNPVMNFIGQYYAGRGNLTISAEGSNGALIQVWWGSSAEEHSEWTMHGTFDEAAMEITYSDCEKHDFVVDDNGEIVSDETAYTNGTGKIVINEDYSIVWIDDQDHIADDLTMTM